MFLDASLWNEKKNREKKVVRIKKMGNLPEYDI